METERMRILELVAQGKLSVEEAETLLRAWGGETLSTEAERREVAAQAETKPRERPRRMRIQVSDLKSHRTRVNIVLPIALVKAGIRLGAALKPWTWDASEATGEEGGTARPPQEVMAQLGENLEALEALFDEADMGPMVDVYDEEEGEHVLITLE